MFEQIQLSLQPASEFIKKFSVVVYDGADAGNIFEGGGRKKINRHRNIAGNIIQTNKPLFLKTQRQHADTAAVADNFINGKRGIACITYMFGAAKQVFKKLGVSVIIHLNNQAEIINHIFKINGVAVTGQIFGRGKKTEFQFFGIENNAIVPGRFVKGKADFIRDIIAI